MTSPRQEGEGGGVATDEVQFAEANGQDGFGLRKDAKQIRIFPSLELSDSSPFHFNTVVDYTWEVQYGYGRLIATHVSSKFIAYVVKVGTAGAVRVIDMDSKERVLMKGERGLVKDVDFLHKVDDIIVGFIDEYGSFYINKIVKELKTGKLTANPIMKVTLDGSPCRAEIRRFVWCKYVPDELKEVASPKDCSYHFAVLQRDIIYAGNLVQIVQGSGEGSHQFSEVRNEFLTIDTHSSAVTDASFAPDGTALATSSKDGTVKFFQIYFQERSSPARCLYSWAPHGGRPIDKIFFLDNYTLTKTIGSETQYWNFIITAADNCSELKLFTCKSWQCLQTLRFVHPMKGAQWRIELDLTAHYLMATEIHTRAMYLIHLKFNESEARFNWIHEYSLPWSIIGFNIDTASTVRFADAVARGLGPSSDHGSYAKDDVLYLVDINVIQPKSMQQGSVAHKKPTAMSRSRSSGSRRRISFNRSVDLREFQDGQARAVDEVMSSGPIHSYLQNNTKRGSSVSPNSVTKEVTSAAEMTEQLSSLIGVSPAGAKHGKQRSPTISKTPSPSPRQAHQIPSEQEVRTNGSTSKTSTSSSPSREVEEILSPKGTQNFGGRGSGVGLEGNIVLNAAMALSSNVDNANFDFQSQKRVSSKADSDLPFSKMLEKFSYLTDLVTVQAKEIRELKQELGRATVLQIQKIEQDSAVYNRMLEKHAQQTQHQLSRLEEMVKTLEATVKHGSASAIPPNLAEVLASSIGAVVNKELQNVVPQAMSHQFDPARLNISSQIDRLTNVVEANLAQNINQIMQRDRVWQTLTNAFQSTVKSVFDSTFNDIFMTVVFTRCQTAVQEMLMQVSETFRNGTKEYLNGLESVLDKERKREDFQELVSTQMVHMQDALTSALQVEIEVQMLRVLGGIQGGVVRPLEEYLGRELDRNFQDQQRYLELLIGTHNLRLQK